ncbi:multidrug ABC transporter [Candidatus Saccharibacteria bacterium]|nr:multidrug ABC transporter [Candidatus Saccharibacteria bacterium]
MKSDVLIYSSILLLGVFISAVSQVLLKKESQKEHASRIKEYFNIRVIVAYAIFFASTFLSIFAYKGIPLSWGPVIAATSYIYVTIFGVLIFREKLSFRKVVALVFIISGILVYSFFG